MSWDLSWHPYPPDVPLAKRQLCAFPGCRRPGEVVLVRSWIGTLSGFADKEGSTTVWCLADAREQGYGPDAPGVVPPEHLNAFQRWVVKTLSKGEEPRG